MEALLKQIHHNHNTALEGMFRDCSEQILEIARLCSEALARGNKLLFCGNGGSACDAMHIAGEFVGRFVGDRRSLPAIALTADSGLITAIANDYGYDHIFARQVEGLGAPGDVMIALSTSGKSPSVLRAIETAKSKQLKTVLFTGEKARTLPQLADITLIVPSTITAHVQEAHATALHALAALIESDLKLSTPV